MNAYALKKLAKNYMNIWTADSQGLLDIYADPDLVVEYTHFNKIEGVAAYKQMLKTTYNFFPDIDIRITEIIPNKKKKNITLFWSYKGTHKNGLLFGIKPQNKEVVVNGMTVLEVEKRKVVREKGIVDNMSLFMQLQEVGAEEESS